MNIEFRDKVAIVTGGASGIGAALARLLVESGARVMIADVDESKGKPLAQELGMRARFARTDVTRVEACERVAGQTIAAFGRIDMLFNNAGKGLLGDATSTAPEVWNYMIDVNMNSAFRVTRAVLPHLKSAGGGSIVNTSSVCGLAGDYGMVAYDTAKGGLINMTRCLALDHAKDNIRVNAVCPGVIGDTAMTTELPKGPGGAALWNSRTAMGRLGKAIEVARVMAFLASDLASYMTGSVVVVDGGLLANTGIPTPADVATAVSLDAAMTLNAAMSLNAAMASMPR
jgi:meso-butanediol dehydrogenase / (S,S)-butanediol dehydrogenase / diacetyl reductase